MCDDTVRIVGTCSYCCGNVLLRPHTREASCGCGATVITCRLLTGGKIKTARSTG